MALNSDMLKKIFSPACLEVSDKIPFELLEKIRIQKRRHFSNKRQSQWLFFFFFSAGGKGC